MALNEVYVILDTKFVNASLATFEITYYVRSSFK